MASQTIDSPVGLSQPLLGIPMNIGDYFHAHSFRKSEVGGLMNPLLMFDHFWMKRDTFGWHPHIGISAVTYVFEDSKSAHYNADSMGDISPINPGSLHWMVAGSGAMHRERPEGDDSVVHALQFFVDLPEKSKSVHPYSVHLDADNVPEVIQDGASIRVVAGQLGGVRSQVVLPQPFLLYDILLRERKPLEVPLPGNWGAWLYSVRGEAIVAIDGRTRILEQNHAVALNTGSVDRIASIQGEGRTQVVVLAGAIIPHAKATAQ